MVEASLNHIFADIENCLGTDPVASIEFFERKFGRLSQRRAFVSRKNIDEYAEVWKEASFQINHCGDDADASDLRLINAVLQILNETVESGHTPGVLCIMTNGDAIYRDIIRNAKRHGWTVIALSWGGLRGRLLSIVDHHFDLRAEATG